MKIRFETSECGRCGGTGRYSFNQIDGDRCYGCGGSTRALTRKGKAARKAYDDLVDELLTVTYGDLSIGEVIWHNLSQSLTGTRMGWTKVESITPDPLNPGCVAIETTKGPGVHAPAEFSVKRYDRELLAGIASDIVACYPGATVIE